MLICLQQEGHVKYAGWVLKFQFRGDYDSKLQQLVKEMEADLKAWRTEVNLHREKLYGLNYYTTPQLLSLRENLGELKNPEGAATTLSMDTLSLLQSVSLEVSANPSIIQDVVRNVVAILSEHQREDGDSLVHHTKNSVPNIEMAISDQVSHCTSETESSQQPFESLHEKLSEKQLEIFTNLVNVYNYPEHVVLRGLEIHGNDQDEVERWVMDNGLSDSDTEEAAGPQASVPHVEEGVEGTVTPEHLELHRITKPLITESEGVKCLIQVGFSEEQAVDAIEQCGDSVEVAMDYLMHSEARVGTLQSETLDHGRDERYIANSDAVLTINFIDLL